MKKEHVVKRNGGYYVTNSRVSLDSIVYAFREGNSAEAIRWAFPSLTLEQVYGAITFYLGNQKKIDNYLITSEIEFEAFRKKNHEDLKMNAPELYRKLRSAKVQAG